MGPGTFFSRPNPLLFDTLNPPLPNSFPMLMSSFFTSIFSLFSLSYISALFPVSRQCCCSDITRSPCLWLGLILLDSRVHVMKTYVSLSLLHQLLNPFVLLFCSLRYQCFLFLSAICFVLCSIIPESWFFFCFCHVSSLDPGTIDICQSRCRLKYINILMHCHISIHYG